jgi:hypothetical protein
MPAETIFIVRHAEKPEEEHGRGRVCSGVTIDGKRCESSLSVAGWQRAGALAVLFGPHAVQRGLQTPDRLIAVSYDEVENGEGGKRKSRAHKRRDDTPEHRPFQTVHPLGRVLDVPITCEWKKGDEAALIADVLDSGSRVTLICWEHDRIPSLAERIPLVDEEALPTHWPDYRFDLIWRFRRVARNVVTYDFDEVAQHVLPGDGT